MPLQMHRQQNVLHNVLGLIDRLPCPRQSTPCPSPQDRRDGLEQAVVRRTVARNGRPHQAGPFVFTLAHVRSWIAIRLIFQFVTSEGFTHEVVIYAIRRGADGRPLPCANRLITPISSAGTGTIDSKTILRTARAGQSANAQLSPSVTRRFPLFAPLRTRPRVSFCDQGLANWGDCP